MLKSFRITLTGHISGFAAPSVGDIRNVSELPTKRGIVGMLGCCCGIKRKDPDLKEIYDSISINAFETPGFREYKTFKHLWDIQTARALPDENGDIPGFPTATIDEKTGKPKTKNASVQRFKGYLMDVSFQVIITAANDVADVLFEAVSDPVWIPYLGRKCCMLSEPMNPTWIN